MGDSFESSEPARKRSRLGDEDYRTNRRDLRSSLTGSISPPPLRRARIPAPTLMPSPFQLTSIRDLPASSNVDAVSLKDILGDPLIAECWEFNYLHDLDFLMGSFDNDVRDLVKVHVVHGFWKNEDTSRLSLKVFIHMALGNEAEDENIG
jgi:tyrosyl-DNA phosphodiesterase-1